MTKPVDPVVIFPRDTVLASLIIIAAEVVLVVVSAPVKVMAPSLPSIVMVLLPASIVLPVVKLIPAPVTETAPVVVILAEIIAVLATVKALLKLDAPPEKVTPVPPAVNVVIPLMVPPPETAFTVIVPDPAAVMFNEVAVMKSSSASVRLNPAPAVPKNTFTPELLVMLTVPALIAAPIETSLAIAESVELPANVVDCATVTFPGVVSRVISRLST